MGLGPQTDCRSCSDWFSGADPAGTAPSFGSSINISECLERPVGVCALLGAPSVHPILLWLVLVFHEGSIMGGGADRCAHSEIDVLD